VQHGTILPGATDTEAVDSETIWNAECGRPDSRACGRVDGE
jgi:hypothetical protein